MARSEDEIGIFQEIDRQRIANDQYGPGHRYPRLMCEAELPDIYLQEDNPVTEEVEIEVTGRGARERKVTKYDDGLTEEQWLMAVDADDDTIEAAIARKQARVERRKSNKAGRGLGDDESSPEPEPEIDDDETPKKRRRGPPPKRKAEEIIDETPQPKRKRGRQPKVPDTLSPSDRATLTSILDSTIQSLLDMEAEVPPEGSDSEEGPMVRAILDPFMKPPPRSLYPDYYMIIQKPIAMDTIQKKVKRGDYQNLRGFVEDIHLLCQNARTYNEDTSVLFQDANDIEVSLA
jgi:ATP-dependent helicase STH1/SNF2